MGMVVRFICAMNSPSCLPKYVHPRHRLKTMEIIRCLIWKCHHLRPIRVYCHNQNSHRPTPHTNEFFVFVVFPNNIPTEHREIFGTPPHPNKQTIHTSDSDGAKLRAIIIYAMTINLFALLSLCTFRLIVFRPEYIPLSASFSMGGEH